MAQQGRAREICRQATSNTCIRVLAVARTRQLPESSTRCQQASTKQLRRTTLMVAALRNDCPSMVVFLLIAMPRSTLRLTTSATVMPLAVTQQLTGVSVSIRPKSPTLSKSTSTRSKPRQLRSHMPQVGPELVDTPILMRVQVGRGETAIGLARLIKHLSGHQRPVRQIRTLLDHLSTVVAVVTRARPTKAVSMLTIARCERHITLQATLAPPVAMSTPITPAPLKPLNMRQGPIARSI